MFLALHTIFIATLALLPQIAWSQSNITSSAYFQDLFQCLEGAGLSSLVSLASTVFNNSTSCPSIVYLSQGNWSMFAPTNEVLDAAELNNTSVDFLADLICYHIVSGGFSDPNIELPTLFANSYPNITLGRTMLNDSQYVFLEGNKSQVLGWTKYDDETAAQMNTDASNITVLNTTQCFNVLVNVVDGIVPLPMNFSAAINDLLQYTQNLTSLGGMLNATTILTSNGTNVTLMQDLTDARGFTLFAPNDEAMKIVGQSLTALANNMTAFSNLLGNHIINGTSIYSASLVSSNSFRTAMGEELTFNKNSSGTFVHSAGYSAKITASDVLLNNGVIHVIDRFLVDMNADIEAAQDAYATATSLAAIPTTETGIVGVNLPTATPTSNGVDGTLRPWSEFESPDNFKMALIVMGLLGAAVL